MNRTSAAETALVSLLDESDIAVNAAGALVDRGNDAGRAVLEEASNSPDPETAQYAKDLLDELNWREGR